MNMILYLKVSLIVITVTKGCRSSSIKTTKVDTTSTLPIPNPKYLDFLNETIVVVRWEPVKISENNSILGYKVKLWEDQKKKVIKWVEKNGKMEMIEVLVPIKKSFHVLPTHEPVFEAVVPPDVFEASFDVKLNEHYELRAQSFNADGDGPLSHTHGFRIHPPDEHEKKETSTTAMFDVTERVLPLSEIAESPKEMSPIESPNPQIDSMRKIVIKILSSN